MPRKTNPEPVARKSLTLELRLWDEITAYQQAEGIKTEAEAARRVIQAGLRAEKRRMHK